MVSSAGERDIDTDAIDMEAKVHVITEGTSDGEEVGDGLTVLGKGQVDKDRLNRLGYPYEEQVWDAPFHTR